MVFSGKNGRGPSDPATARILSGAEAYWQALRPGTDIPMRSQVDPRGLEQALPFTFLLQYEDRLARFRLAGQRVADLLGAELEGAPFHLLFAPSCHATINIAMAGVFDTPAILRASMESVATQGRPALSGQMILLPLRHSDGSISRALGVLVPSGQPGRRPRHFDSITPMPVPVGAPPVPMSTPADYGMAEAPAPFLPRANQKKGRPAKTKRPRFRIIDGSKP